MIDSSEFSGAYTQQAELFALRFRARLKLSVHRRSLSALAGPNRSSMRGRGLDFDEVRAYQPGDEVRAIDWRVTARTGEAHTKLYREERERPVLIVTDQRQPMFFGTQKCFKSVLAAQVCGLLAWSALRNNDRVGGFVWGQQQHVEVRPKRSKASVLKLLHTVHELNNQLGADNVSAGTPLSINTALIDLRRITRPGSAIFIISDFHDFDDDASKQLFNLARHCEVTAVLVNDRLEQNLPPAGQYSVTDGLRRGVLNTRAAKLRDDYARHFRQRREHLHMSLASYGVPLIEMQTGCEPLTELLKYYAYYRGS